MKNLVVLAMMLLSSVTFAQKTNDQDVAAWSCSGRCGQTEAVGQGETAADALRNAQAHCRNNSLYVAVLGTSMMGLPNRVIRWLPANVQNACVRN